MKTNVKDYEKEREELLKSIHENYTSEELKTYEMSNDLFPENDVELTITSNDKGAYNGE